MDGNIVKLVFQTVMAGSGFAKVNAETSELMKKMGKMSQGVQIMGRAFGNLGGIMGRSIGMLMQGGIWGAAAEKSKEAAERLAESKHQAIVFAQRYYALEDKIAQEGEKTGLQSEKEVECLRAKVKLMLDAAKAEVADRTRGVETAQATGGGYDVDIARKELELAVARQKNVVAEARRLVSERRRAKELAEAETPAATRAAASWRDGAAETTAAERAGHSALHAA